MITESDREYMMLAIEEARRGNGTTNPNPMVGAVIVKDDRIIGKGFHERYGCPHAERNALASCTEDPAGATIYVTLVPCNHYGNTPPCTEAIIEHKLARVVIGSKDPNPEAAGGEEVLRKAGIQVDTDCLREECDALNPVFFKFMKEHLPYVTMKYAMSLDGKIACATGESQWITSGEARLHTHRLRATHMAILVGADTVIQDDPLLTCRTGGLSPIRIICDTHLRTSPDAQVYLTASNENPAYRSPRTILATCESDPALLEPYTSKGTVVLTLPEDESCHVDLNALMHSLADRKIDSVLIEGGGEVNWSVLQEGIVDRVEVYIAPKILGGRNAKGPVGGPGVPCPNDSFRLKNMQIRNIGEDYLLSGEVITCSQESLKK